MGIDSKTPKQVLTGFLFGAIAMVAIFGIQILLGFIKIDRFVWQDANIQKSVLNIIDSIILYSAAAFLEEIAFRGYIYQEFKSKFNIYISLLLSGLLFDFTHVFNAGFGLDFVIQGIIASAFFLLLRNYTGNLWASTGFHIAWNIFQGVVLGLATYKMADFSSVIYLSSQSGPAWIVGNAPSIESGLLYGLVYVVGSAVLFKLMNRNPDNYNPKKTSTS